MDNQKLVVALLLIAIIFSVLTMVVTMTSDEVGLPGNVISDPDDIITASLTLEILERPSAGGA